MEMIYGLLFVLSVNAFYYLFFQREGCFFHTFVKTPGTHSSACFKCGKVRSLFNVD